MSKPIPIARTATPPAAPPAIAPTFVDFWLTTWDGVEVGGASALGMVEEALLIVAEDKELPAVVEKPVIGT